MPWKKVLIIAGAVAGGGAATLALFSLFSRRPDDLGVKDGRLRPCPGSPNCVCSQDEGERHHVEPLRFEGSPEEAWARLKRALASQPRTRVVTDEGDYLHAECTSLIFRFVDDVEFLMDRGAKVVHVRSASRAGKGDLGANRRRVEAIRRAFTGGPT